MRGSDRRSGELFSYVDLEARVPAKHPLRKIRQLVNDVLASLDGEFAMLYSALGRESIPPERLLRALLLQALFTIRSERQLMEQLDYNLLFRWFVGLGIDEAVWVPTVFTKNRDRLLEADVAAKFMSELLAHKEVRKLLSDEHFSVDGTLIEAWASMKSFQPKPTATEPVAKDGGGSSDDGPAGDARTKPSNTKPTKTEPTAQPKAEDRSRNDRNADVDFHGRRRTNETHASITDPEARLYRKGKGKEAKLCFMGHALMENRHGLIVETELTHADGFGEAQSSACDDQSPLPRRTPNHGRCRQGLRHG
jgi:transposase